MCTHEPTHVYASTYVSYVHRVFLNRPPVPSPNLLGFSGRAPRVGKKHASAYQRACIPVRGSKEEKKTMRNTYETKERRKSDVPDSVQRLRYIRGPRSRAPKKNTRRWTARRCADGAKSVSPAQLRAYIDYRSTPETWTLDTCNFPCERVIIFFLLSHQSRNPDSRAYNVRREADIINSSFIVPRPSFRFAGSTVWSRSPPWECALVIALRYSFDICKKKKSIF